LGEDRLISPVVVRGLGKTRQTGVWVPSLQRVNRVKALELLDNIR